VAPVGLVGSRSHNLQFGTSATDYTVQETKAPTGYAIDDGAAKDVNVNANAKCTDATFGGATISFTDSPLTNVSASATSQKAGATESAIQCKDSNGNPIGDSPDPNDAADPPSAQGGTVDPATVTANGANGLKPGTYTCTIFIDP
jgi:uncharacterized surface anchored protein